MKPDSSLVLFTKPPRPGRVKTRLIAAPPAGLSARQAADLHWALVLDQLDRLAGRTFSLHVAWALGDGESPPSIGLPGFRQRGVDLGERLWRGLSRVAGEARRVAAVGSDHPGLTRARVDEAFDRLRQGAELVLGPAADGGYYLLAVASDKLDARLFENIDWSTGSVLEQTLARGRSLGLTTELLAEGRDVDTPADLARLAADLAAGGDGSPRARGLLESWGRLERCGS